VHGHTYKVCECPRTVPVLYVDKYFVRGQCLFSTGSDEKQQTKSAGLNVFAYSWRSPLFLSMFHLFSFVEFERLTCRKIIILYFIEDLQSCAYLWNAHFADYKNLIKKVDAIDFLAVM
jgi:hypothetical protein